MKRRCPRCKVLKELNQAEFYHWTDKKTGEVRYQGWCKTCFSTYAKTRSKKSSARAIENASARVVTYKPDSDREALYRRMDERHQRRQSEIKKDS